MNKYLFIIALLCGGLFTLSTTADFTDKAYNAVSKRVIRFHVLANSNSNEDQELKLYVKDSVIEYLRDGLSETEDLEASRKYITEHLADIKDYATSLIKSQGYNYAVNVSLAQSSFPVKTYGNISLPAGEYDALRIEIGDAEGENWWCVMYPPLCYVDWVTEDSGEVLKAVVSSDELKNYYKNGQVKFKIVELVKKYVVKK